jgi:hypothetical protein
VSLPWSDRHGLEIHGRPIATAVTAHRLAGSVAVGEGRTVPVVVIGDDLTISEATRRFVRLGEAEWRIEGELGAARATTLEVDERGIPVGSGTRWGGRSRSNDPAFPAMVERLWTSPSGGTAFGESR